MRIEDFIAKEVLSRLQGKGYPYSCVKRCCDVAIEVFYKTTSFRAGGGGMAEAAINAGVTYAKNFRPSVYFYAPKYTRTAPKAIEKIKKKYAGAHK